MLKVINSGLAKKGEGFERLFKFCYEYRRAAVANGEETPIMDLVVFRPLRMIFGGRLKFIATGKASPSRLPKLWGVNSIDIMNFGQETRHKTGPHSGPTSVLGHKSFDMPQNSKK